ncbi:hypothetical protein LSAT2_012017, partial [Lamellibrachia satsuma]
MVFRKEFGDSEEEMCELLLDADMLPPHHQPQPITPPATTHHTTGHNPSHHRPQLITPPATTHHTT